MTGFVCRRGPLDETQAHEQRKKQDVCSLFSWRAPSLFSWCAFETNSREQDVGREMAGGAQAQPTHRYQKFCCVLEGQAP